MLVLFGIDLGRIRRSLKALTLYLSDLHTLKGQKGSSIRIFQFGKLYPRLFDRFGDSGSIKGHYFQQDLLVARRIYVNNPITHVDVGSRVDGFVAHVASFRKLMYLIFVSYLAQYQILDSYKQIL